MGPLPLVLGVTGHRDLIETDKPFIERQILEKFRGYCSQYPNTPLIVVSGLAEGADRLGAKAALLAGARLVSVLPMPAGEYEKDFKSPESLLEFRTLLDKSWRVICLNESSNAAIAGGGFDGEARNLCYGSLGVFLANYCQDLIAVWNGRDNSAIGGTAEVVKMKLEGVSARYLGNDQSELLPGNGLLLHLKVCRISDPDRFAPVWQEPRFPAQTNRDIQHENELLEDFNRKAAFLQSGKGRVEVDRSEGYLLGAGVSKADLPEDQKSLVEIFGCADALAIRKQASVLNAQRVFLALTFVSTAFIEAAENLKDHFVAVHSLALLFSVVTVGFFFYWKKTRSEDSQIDWRLIAEGVRVVFFWKRGGINRNIATALPVDPRCEMDWARRGITAADLLASPSPKPDFEYVNRAWFDDQKKFFGRKTGEMNAAIHRFGILISLLTLFFFLILFAKPFIGRLEGWIEYEEENLVGYLSFATLIGFFALLRIPTLIAMLVAYLEITGKEEIFRQYQRAEMVFKAASRQFGETENEGKKRLLVAVGEQALEESTEWAKIRRDRPIPHPHL